MQDSFWEFVKITTVGPVYLRLNADVLQLINQLAIDVLVRCHKCTRPLLLDKNGVLHMRDVYFLVEDVYLCYQCSIYNELTRDLTATELEEHLSQVKDL
jgi:hypothetical protein